MQIPINAKTIVCILGFRMQSTSLSHLNLIQSPPNSFFFFWGGEGGRKEACQTTDCHTVLTGGKYKNVFPKWYCKSIYYRNWKTAMDSKWIYVETPFWKRRMSCTVLSPPLLRMRPYLGYCLLSDGAWPTLTSIKSLFHREATPMWFESFH